MPLAKIHVLEAQYDEARMNGVSATEVKVGGLHFVQEDSRGRIGNAIVEWMGRLG